MPPFFEAAPYRAGLLDLELHSLAPESVADRALFYHRELSLDLDDLRALLDLQADYRRKLRRGRIEFALAGHQVRPTAQPFPPPSEAAAHLKTRAALFFQEEDRVPTYIELVRMALGEDRWNQLVGLYVEDTRRELELLAPVIAAAVAPAFTLHSSDGEIVDPNGDPPEQEGGESLLAGSRGELAPAGEDELDGAEGEPQGVGARGGPTEREWVPRG
ncbi:hypothetical protein [Frankia sp. R82]|uniref:hypothetical protein n=1 Tax=Frankia sp. R82 TaxID=2950553 RepID=UPI002043BA13|nr:hypothetical protein [Frankia sp. R82]MCM3884311.1 hypothetical protein [Frankia sp. R82]